MKIRSSIMALVVCSLLPSAALASDLSVYFPQAANESVELFDCETGESLGVQDARALVELNACLAPACARHTLIDDYGIKWDYCDGACSDDKICTPTYRDPEHPANGIKRCSCKPPPPPPPAGG